MSMNNNDVMVAFLETEFPNKSVLAAALVDGNDDLEELWSRQVGMVCMSVDADTEFSDAVAAAMEPLQYEIVSAEVEENIDYNYKYITAEVKFADRTVNFLEYVDEDGDLVTEDCHQDMPDTEIKKYLDTILVDSDGYQSGGLGEAVQILVDEIGYKAFTLATC